MSAHHSDLFAALRQATESGVHPKQLWFERILTPAHITSFRLLSHVVFNRQPRGRSH